MINSATQIGDNVQLRHGVTLGEKEEAGVLYAPVIGNNVSIGASAIILGRVKVGDNAVIGAGAVVVQDVPADATVAGNPAKLIGR